MEEVDGGVNSNANNPGPIDDSVLYDQEAHVSSAVWEEQERGPLKCAERARDWVLTEQQKELVNKAGFGHLSQVPRISLDKPLISALVERWRRETNTFHMPLGEMTVTLQDVAYLLGLPIDGEPVVGPTHTSCDSVCREYLGKSPPDSGGGMVKLTWLKHEFRKCPPHASAQEIAFHTRAYLLYLVGTTIFSTTASNTIQVMYLPFLQNFDEAGKYAWGAATLSFLYRALGKASIGTKKNINGCLTLLQCWSYYHLKIGRPVPIHEISFPLVQRWKGTHKCGHDLRFYREALNTMTQSDVDWCPYKDINHDLVPENIKNQLVVVGRSKTMLLCFDKAERHLPDRCLRQFGMPQRIPQKVERWERKGRSPKGDNGGVDPCGPEVCEWKNRRLHIVEAGEGNVDDEDEYMKWYSRITRRFVGRKPHISQGEEDSTNQLPDDHNATEYQEAYEDQFSAALLFEVPHCPSLDDLF